MLSQEYCVLDVNNFIGKFCIIQLCECGLEYDIIYFEDKFYICINLDVQNFCLMEMFVDVIIKENWKEVIVYCKDVLLEGMDVFKNYLVFSECKGGII